MTIQLSNRVQQVKPSPTLAITAKAAELRAQGKNIIGLGAGEPDFDTPDHIKDGGIKAIQNGQTRYTPVDGTPDLKKAIIEKFKTDNGLDYEMNQVMVSCGGKQTFYNLAQAILNDGDEVIIPAPYWVSYPDMTLLAGGVPVIVEAGKDQNYKITPEQLEAAITDKTKLFVINSPSNPSGVAYTAEELKALAEVLLKYPQVVIATDDMYEKIWWMDEPFSNILMVCPELYERTMVLNGVSKAYAMTGWRIGYIAGPAAIVGAMKKIQSQSTSNPAAMSQAAAVTAMTGDQGCIDPMLKAFKERHDFVYNKVNSIKGLSCIESDGTFYTFVYAQEAIDYLEGINNDLDLAAYLLEDAEVAIVPGSAFGLEGYFRMSYATSMDNLVEALDRIEKALNK
ncbi:MAG: pyridoxal phosphate-dependent aminotransferase [Gammaproteobacteria bacterium]|nr:MAG: pyridoxal phosphate-dependent aminotransferase [Gammaproteobacteria bacterium]